MFLFIIAIIKGRVVVDITLDFGIMVVMIDTHLFIIQFFLCEFKWRTCEVKWSLLVLILQMCIWLKVFMVFCNFLLNDSTSSLMHEDGCKSKRWGTHITITFVFTVSLANSERVLKPSLVSFLATSLVPPQIITTFFFRSSFTFMVLVIALKFALGFVDSKSTTWAT